MNKYEIAAALAIAGIDTNEWMKIPAALQREIFGYNVFGRQSVRFDTTNQGIVEIGRSAAYGTDWTSLTLSFDELAAKLGTRIMV